MATMNKLRTDMAQRFLDALNQGQIPWKACWQGTRPYNAATGKHYRGVNAMFLSYIAEERGFTDPRWCTYIQAEKNGWQVRKGAESAKVEYWAYYDKKQKKLLSWEDARKLLEADPAYELNLQLSSRIHSVFNAEQIDGIPALRQNTTDIGAIREQRDKLILNMGVGYQEEGTRAFYSPGSDAVTLPPEASFDDTYSYMATFLHECGHASGHPSRLNRDLGGFFGSESYAREELRAEIASAFTAQALGLQLSSEQLEYHMSQHIAYVQSWSAALQKNPEELFRAIKAAEEISDYLIEKGEFELERTEKKTPPQLFKAETVQQRKIAEWLADQGIKGEDMAKAELMGPAIVRITNPAGQYMDVYCAEDYSVRILQITAEREEELQGYFWNETNDPEDQEWRDDLTPDEAAMVEQWDLQTARGISRLAQAILDRSAGTEKILVAVESTDDYTDHRFHQELTDIDKQNPDRSWGTVVDKYRLVKIGSSGRIEVLDGDLVFTSRSAAEAAASCIPYAQLVAYDELVKSAAAGFRAKYTLEEIAGSSGLRLRFYGHGEIEGYSFASARPYQAQIDRIKEVVIERGITAVGRNVLCDFPALKKVTWPDTIQKSDPFTLKNCPSLKEIEFTGTHLRHMDIQYLSSPREILILGPQYPEMTREQLDEIAAGKREGLSPEQIKVYAKKEFTSLQMNSIRYSYAAGLTAEQIGLLANPAFDAVQMDILRASFQAGMTMEQVRLFARPALSASQMLDAHLTLQHGRYWDPPTDQPLHPVEEIAAAEATEREFWDMTAFLERGGNIAELAAPQYPEAPDWDP